MRTFSELSVTAVLGSKLRWRILTIQNSLVIYEEKFTALLTVVIRLTVEQLANSREIWSRNQNQ